MDFAIDSSVTSPRIDTRWRASKHGQDSAQPGTLDLTKFVDGTHYNIGSRTDNVVPSGVAVEFNSTTGLYEPWNAGAHAAAGTWEATTAYAVGARVKLASGIVLQATTAGTSGSTAPTAPGAVGGTVTDGTVVWTRQPEAKPIAGFINDDQGIDLYRRAGVAKSTTGAFALLLHGIIEVAQLPVASQAAAVKAAPSTGSFIYN